MFLSPSSIHFTSCTGHLSIEEITRERDIIEASRHFVQNMDRARLQVAEKDGHYFTLNNTRLLVFRRLEEEGRCSRVKVDCVPLNAIPQGIRMMMVAPTFKSNASSTDTGKYSNANLYTMFIDPIMAFLITSLLMVQIRNTDTKQYKNNLYYQVQSQKNDI